MTSNTDTEHIYTQIRHTFKDYVAQQCKTLHENLELKHRTEIDEKCAKLHDEISAFEGEIKMLMEENATMKNKLATLDLSHRTDDTIRTMEFISINGSTPNSRLSSFSNLSIDNTDNTDKTITESKPPRISPKHSDDGAKYQCESCKKVFDYEINLQWHSDNNCLQSFKMMNAIGNATEKQTNGDHNHIDCHMQSGSNERNVFVCKEDNCGESFHYKQHFDVHKRIHSDDVYVCNYKTCGRMFTKIMDFIRHIRVHVRVKSYVCKMPECEKCQHKDNNEPAIESTESNRNSNFSEKSDLKQEEKEKHIGNNGDNDEKIFVCENVKCGKKFRNEDMLMAHQWIHNTKTTMREKKIASKMFANPHIF